MIRFAMVVASALGCALTAALGNFMAPLLRAFRQPGQKLRAEEPQKQQTPTMGGLCLMVGVLAAVGVGWTAACAVQPELLGAEGLWTTRLLTALFGAMVFGAIGLADDLARLRSGSPLGLRPGVRLALTAGAAAAVQVLLAANHCLASGLNLPGVGYVELGALAPLVWEGLLVALAESVRVTDWLGTDGVVCGTAFLAMLGLMGAVTLLGWFPLGVFPAALAGALMAFLLWNFYPAKLLPGAVGSLFLAGALGCIPLSIGWPDLVFPLALPYWAEGGMLLIQRVVLWASHGRRQVFGTAPLHRWLETRGRGPIAIFYLFCLLVLLGVGLTLKLAQGY